ncbi:MAG: N-acetylmuramoyl-L-alanine amidase [Desulfosporosinus sp.]|nr:N-acetylmuramoyl-L-alanine amidase [Desulfosporosinus sp.]
MSYTIVQNFIPGLPKEAYDGGVGNYVGVIAHSTANNGDSADGERNYESTTWQNAFVHYFVDDQKIEQVADTNYLCYGAGHTANHMGYAQVELCQSTDPAKFVAAYAQYVWLLAKLLYNRKLSVVDGVTLMSHAQVSAKWKETTHTDPIDYLASHGKTWANLVADVTVSYNEMEGNDLKLQTLILYYGDADLPIAADLALHFGCPIVQAAYATADLLNSATTKYQVGGATAPAGVTLLGGADRFATMKAVLKTLGEI